MAAGPNICIDRRAQQRRSSAPGHAVGAVPPMHLVRRALTSALGVGAILVFASVISVADSYPTKPIKLVIPVGAGSAADVRARRIGERPACRGDEAVKGMR